MANFRKITCLTQDPVFSVEYSNEFKSRVALIAVVDLDDPLNTLKRVKGKNLVLLNELEYYLEELVENSDEFNVKDFVIQVDYPNMSDGGNLVVINKKITRKKYKKSL
jgi:hypothetical protein